MHSQRRTWKSSEFFMRASWPAFQDSSDRIRACCCVCRCTMRLSCSAFHSACLPGSHTIHWTHMNSSHLLHSSTSALPDASLLEPFSRTY